MSLEHWMLAAIITIGLSLNGWAIWIAHQIHRDQVVHILQGRSIKDVVDELHRIHLERGGAR
jgi:hypothetical protein